VEAKLLPNTNYRFRVNDSEVVRFVDGNAGETGFVAGRGPDAHFGDFVVWRKDGLPSYQLACVVDDAATGVTEVVRGKDLLRSTARQILLQRALGLATPRYFHCELMRDDSGVRLAKRHDALSLRALRQAGVSQAEVIRRLNAGPSMLERIDSVPGIWEDTRAIK
jgi:glutamyl-tRNA synthetase